MTITSVSVSMLKKKKKKESFHFSPTICVIVGRCVVAARFFFSRFSALAVSKLGLYQLQSNQGAMSIWHNTVTRVLKSMYTLGVRVVSFVG